MKSRWQIIVAVLTVMVLLAGCGGQPATSAPAATQAPAQAATQAPTQAPTEAPTQAPAKGPIKIGVLAPLTGTFAANGQDMVKGFQMYWEEVGNKCAGREVQLFIEDTAGEPDVGLNKARLLVEQRQVHMLVGVQKANVGLAVAEYVKTTGTPFFIPVTAADDLTQRNRIPNVIRLAGWSSSSTTHPLGEWAATKKGYKTVVTIAEDYAFGHESVGGFVNTFTDNGGKLLAAIWHPLGNMDFSPYLSQIDNYKPDVVFTQESGGDAVRFLKAWHDMGYDKKYPLLGQQTLTDQSNLRGMGDEALGVITAGHFAEGRDAPETKAFVEKFEKRYGELPSYYAADMYTAAHWLDVAMQKINGNVEDQELLLKTVRETEIPETPMGPVKLDEYGGTIFNVYLRQVEKRPDGKLWNVVIETFPNVSQFYKYNPEEYLKQPVYSRDYLGENWP
jgi:branched-chain amino acid transport system substrate-binding protein